MFGFGPTELIIIAVVVVLLFGASRIPELGRSLGGGIKEFKKGLTEEDKDKKSLGNDQPNDDSNGGTTS